MITVKCDNCAVLIKSGEEYVWYPDWEETFCEPCAKQTGVKQ
jgi:hypothetical protein